MMLQEMSSRQDLGSKITISRICGSRMKNGHLQFVILATQLATHLSTELLNNIIIKVIWK
ncbi:hypothetical protein CF140_03805 [Aeromonas sobria]|nr:hypothetical protein CF140_03805 [Aeromonas sobria]